MIHRTLGIHPHELRMTLLINPSVIRPANDRHPSPHGVALQNDRGRRLPPLRFTAGLLVLLHCSTSLAPTCSAAVPSARIDYAFAYHPRAHGLIMHGGWGPPGWERLSETWKLVSTGWSSLSIDGSPAMSHHSMTYDSARQVLVLCGKDATSGAYQTWEFDGSAWKRRADVFTEIGGDVEVAYDPGRRVTVLYGAGSDGRVDTWEYNGSEWARKSPTRSPVACPDGALMAHHLLTGKIMFVGAGKDSVTQTWLWNGADWSQVVGLEPSNAVGGGMCFDGARREMVLLTTDMQTWTSKGTSWTRKRPSVSPSPTPNRYFSLSYDADRQVAVFFGGESLQPGADSYPEKTWEWDGSSWSELVPGFTLVVARVGEGKVTSSPSGITCGSDCASSYAPGAQVALSASNVTDTVFSRWKGCSPSNEKTCTVVMDRSRKVTATFSSIRITSPTTAVSWEVGTTHKIEWAFTGTPGEAVRINLLKDGALDHTIASSVSLRARQYVWTIPSTVKPASSYRIKIGSVNMSAVWDVSDKDFAITTPGATRSDQQTPSAPVIGVRCDPEYPLSLAADSSGTNRVPTAQRVYGMPARREL